MTSALITRQIKPENIGFSGAKAPTPKDDGSKVFQWSLVTAGNCEMEGVMLELIPDGWADFGANVSSGGNDDSWGILSFHFHQANGLVVWNSGSFWSPTIGVGNTTPWTFQFQYPAVLFDTIATIDFTNHC